MRTIIAGSRHITSSLAVMEAFDSCPFDVTEIVSGGCKGVDALGEKIAKTNKIPHKRFPADWDNLEAPGAQIKSGPFGKYNAAAGRDRNEQMAVYAEALILVWDGLSSGSADMRRRAKKHGLLIHEVIV